MYGSDAGQPPRPLYTKGLSPLCDTLYVHIQVATCLNGTKKGGKTSKAKILGNLKRVIHV